MGQEDFKEIMHSVAAIKADLHAVAGTYKPIPFRAVILEDLRLIKLIEIELQIIIKALDIDSEENR